MTRIAQLLDEKLQTLDPERARDLETLITQAIEQVERNISNDSKSGCPEGDFEQTAGALAGKGFERSSQGTLPRRDAW